MASYYRSVSREWARRPWLGWTGRAAAAYRAWVKGARIERPSWRLVAKAAAAAKQSP